MHALSNVAVTSLSNNVPLTGQSLGAFQWKYYSFVATAGVPFVLLVTAATTSSSSVPDVYIKAGSPPSFRSFDQSDVSSWTVSSITVSNPSATTYYFGLYGFQATQGFSIEVTSGQCPGGCSGHGTCISTSGTYGCSCNAGWGGSDCSTAVTALIQGSVHYDNVDSGKWKYFSLTVGRGFDDLQVVLNSTSGVDVDIYLRFGDLPTWYLFDAADLSLSADVALALENPSLGTYYIGVFGYSSGTSSFQLTYHLLEDCPSACSDHGYCLSNQCQCYFGFTDNVCGTMNSGLQDGQVVNGFVSNRVWNYYWFSANTVEDIVVYVNQTWSFENPDCDIFVRRGAKPTLHAYDFANLLFDDNITIILRDPLFDDYYVGVYGFHECHYNIMVTIPTGCPGGCGPHGTCRTGSTVCECDDGYVGTHCELNAQQIGKNMVVSGTVSNTLNTANARPWVYYNFTAPARHVSIFLQEQSQIPGSVWLFVAENMVPTTLAFDYEDAHVEHLHAVEFYPTPGSSVIIGVHASPICQQATYQLEVLAF